VNPQTIQPLTGLRVCMLLNNDIVRDGRVLKKARTLSEAGARVLIVGQGNEKSPLLDEEPFDATLATPPYTGDSVLKRWSPAWIIRVIANQAYKRVGLLRRLRRGVVMSAFFNKDMQDPAVQFKPHVVEANDVFTGLAALDIAQATGCILVYDTHEYFSGYFTGHNNDKYRQQRSDEIEENLFTHAQQVFAPSTQIAEKIKERYPAILVTALFNSLPFESSIVAPPHRPVRLLDQTSVRSFNGHEAVIKAMKKLKGKATYTIQGQCIDKRYRQSLETLIARFGLGDVVFFEDAFTPGEAIGRASGFDIGLASYPFDVPSKNLTLANRTFTYLNAGLAIAVCGSKANIELPGFNEYGTVLDISSPKTIADSLLPLIDDPALLAHKKERAYAWSQSFSWEHQAEKYLAAYHGLYARD